MDFTGQSVELDELLEHCHAHGITLIEDGAHVIGTKYKGKCNGSIADMTTLSFHPVKTVTCGEGGAVLTNSEELYRKLLLYFAHGITSQPALVEHEPDAAFPKVALQQFFKIAEHLGQCEAPFFRMGEIGQMPE